MSYPIGWHQDASLLTQAVNQYGNPTTAAREIGHPNPRTARECWKNMNAGSAPSSGRMKPAPVERADGEMPAGAKATDTHLEIVSVPNPQGTDQVTPEDLIRGLDLKPDEWDYQVIPNRWDVFVGRDDDGAPMFTTLHQVKVVATRRAEALFKFDVPLNWQPSLAEPPARDPGQPIIIPIFSDPHAPNYQKELVEASVYWLECFQPERVWCLGDAGNNSPFGRHAVNMRKDLHISPEEAVWSTTELLARWSNAAPGAVRTLLFGNHDYWLIKRILEVYPRMMEIRRWGETKPHLAMSTILKLDEIGWSYHETDGEYHDVDIEIVPELVGMHGTLTGKPHGGAVKEMSRWEGVSIIQGHDHTLGMTAIRKRLPNRKHVQRYGICAGSLANADLGYDPAHNIGQGWPVLTLWPDGRWSVDFALYDPVTKSTTWRDWRYDA